VQEAAGDSRVPAGPGEDQGVSQPQEETLTLQDRISEAHDHRVTPPGPAGPAGTGSHTGPAGTGSHPGPGGTGSHPGPGGTGLSKVSEVQEGSSC